MYLDNQADFIKNYIQILTSDGYISESIEDEILSGSISADINIDYSNYD